MILAFSSFGAPGCFRGAWNSWHLQATSFHLIMDFCADHTHWFVLRVFFIVRERGRQTPRAERSALYALLRTAIELESALL